MTEGRLAERRDVCLIGCIAFGPEASVVGCMVRNLSRSGAKLQFGKMDDVPDNFSLSIEEGSEVFRAQKVWHRGFEVGVEFHGTL